MRTTNRNSGWKSLVASLACEMIDNIWIHYFSDVAVNIITTEQQLIPWYHIPNRAMQNQK
jgi:hypothetical protein